MLHSHHLEEFQASAIAPDFAALNFHSSDDNWFIRQWLNWKPNERWKQCPFDSGWYCHTLDPRTGEARNWGPFKPDSPIVDTSKGKPRKYEHPAGFATLALFLKVDRVAWSHIARRYRIPHTPLALRLQDKDPSPHFWQWVWEHNLPIIICEGAKKAAALLCAGYVAIALPGVWNGRRKRKGDRPEQLIPDLQHFAMAGRQVFFCFDHDPKLKTRLHVGNALVRTGKLFEEAGCTVKVIRLPGPEKGVDDFITMRGRTAFDLLYADAVSLSAYEQQKRHWMSGHRLTYPVHMELDCRYLVDGIRQAWASQQFSTASPKSSSLKLESLSLSSSLPPIDDRPADLELSGVIGILSDMGTGKTELLAQIKQAYPKARILNLGHRVALLRNLANRIGTAIYSDYGWNMWREQWLSLTADSLYKLKTEGNQYDFIFLDEVEQFIYHLLCSDTCKEHRHEILQALKHFIYSAKCIILSDAHLSDLSLQFILAMRPDPNEQPFIIQNNYCNGGRDVFWYEGNDRSGIVQNVKQALYAGDKVIVACDGLEFSKDLYEMLQTLFPEKVIECINSHNSGESRAKALLEKINEQVVHLDCLIYSPSINTGISIDVEHFDCVFGVFIGGTLAATDCLQALNRYRPKINWHVWVGDKPIGGYRPINPERVKANKQKENDLCGFLLGIVPGTGERIVQDEFAWNAWAHLTARRNESLNNLRADVRYWLEVQGHTLIPTGDTVSEMAKAELKFARETNEAVRRRGILQAERITATEARQLEAKERPTLQDYYQLERHRIEKSWGREIDEHLIALDNRGRTIAQFAILESLLEPAASVQVINGRRFFFPPDLIAERDQLERDKFHPLDWRNYSVAWAMRVELGLPELLNPEREFRNDDPDLIALAKKAQQNALTIKEFLGITIRTNATPIQVLQQLFEQAGIDLKCDRRKGRRGEQVRIYRINQEQWQLGMSILQHRSQRRRTSIQPTLEVSSDPVATGSILNKDLNKREVVTTEPIPRQKGQKETYSLLLEDVTEALLWIRCAVEDGNSSDLRSVWDHWTSMQRQQLWAEMDNLLQQRIGEMIGSPGEKLDKLQSIPQWLVPGTTVRWLQRTGIWLVEAVKESVAMISNLDFPDVRQQVNWWELENVLLQEF
ncbi:plasmid replication protein, CyRepA1 family [Leptolyngbya ohadii]|uniref:plasmid replication protein, CyRepA1 family n=1 Tax=Leptolyngbya ohadii TaxID=1962290 RepID=UPI000B59D6E7|nr:plasmid replication protein, CyRepA1 family [Leptolyngbya ohadii]